MSSSSLSARLMSIAVPRLIDNVFSGSSSFDDIASPFSFVMSVLSSRFASLTATDAVISLLVGEVSSHSVSHSVC